MRRSYYILLAGAALFSIGLTLTVLWALPIAQELQRDTSMIHGATVPAGKSAVAQFHALSSEKTLMVLVTAKNSVPMTASVISPEGNQILNKKFTETLVQGVTAQVAGNYTLTIKNNDNSRDTNVDVVFGFVPGIGQDKVNVGVYNGLVASSAIVLAGIMTMLVAIVLLALEWRRKKRKI